jgi:hypothetical protein
MHGEIFTALYDVGVAITAIAAQAVPAAPAAASAAAAAAAKAISFAFSDCFCFSIHFRISPAI